MINALLKTLASSLASNPEKVVLRSAGRLAKTDAHRPYPGILQAKDLLAHALALAAKLDQGFQDLGSGAPRVMVLALPAGATFVVSALASLFAGVCFVPVSLPRAGTMAGHFARICRDSGAQSVLCLSADRLMLAQALAEAGGGAVPGHPVLWSFEDLPDAVTWSLPQVLEPSQSGDHGRAAEEAESQPVALQYTSGSSRFPKGVRLTSQSILANASLTHSQWHLDESTVMVTWLPHFHDMGLMGGLLYPLLAGAAVVQLDPLDAIQRPIRWLRAISDHQGTFSGGPTFAFARCLDAIAPKDCQDLDLSSWRVAFCGAEPVHAHVLHRFRETFGGYGLRKESVFACYGLAEYTLLAAGIPGHPVTDEGKGHATGATAPCWLSPIMRQVVRIVDSNSRIPLADGQTGEIWLRGLSKANGYHQMPQDTAELFHGQLQGGAEKTDDTWLRTGDLGYISGDALYITGRLKDILIAHGRKVSAPEVEWMAAGVHPALNPLAAAAFMASPTATTEGVLQIEWKSKVPPDICPQELAQAIRQRVLGAWGVDLQTITFLPRGTLLRTTSGKIRRQEAAAAFYNAQGPKADPEHEKAGI